MLLGLFLGVGGVWISPHMFFGISLAALEVELKKICGLIHTNDVQEKAVDPRQELLVSGRAARRSEYHMFFGISLAALEVELKKICGLVYTNDVREKIGIWRVKDAVD